QHPTLRRIYGVAGGKDSVGPGLEKTWTRLVPCFRNGVQNRQTRVVQYHADRDLVQGCSSGDSVHPDELLGMCSVCHDALRPARRVCLVLDELDSGSRRKNPSLAAVFRLYFVQELPVAKVARKCRCSVGTIMNRLKLLQEKTGATPEQLRRVSPHFERLYGDL